MRAKVYSKTQQSAAHVEPCTHSMNVRRAGPASNNPIFQKVGAIFLQKNVHQASAKENISREKISRQASLS
jgi:hypothetical protein